MRFLIDEQLPPALAANLRAIGHEARHVRETGLGGATDDSVRRFAVKNKFALITKDEDFVDASSNPKLAIVWVRIGNATNAVLWRALEPAIPEIVSALDRGEMLIEVR